MAVIHHALHADATPATCEAARRCAAIARAGDHARLSALGQDLYRAAQGRRAVLAAFGLDDPDHVLPWLVPAAVHPVLVTLLAWVPAMTQLPPDLAVLLAARYRRDGSPVAALAPGGDAFAAPARLLRHLVELPETERLDGAGHRGAWVRVTTLVRRLRQVGEGAAAERIDALGGADPGRRWLVTTTVW